MEEIQEHISRPKRLVSKKKLLTLGVVLIFTGIVIGGWFYLHRDTSPIPKNIRNQVSFPIYYPDSKKLPSGYVFDTKSVSIPQKNGVLYSVNYGSHKIYFSVQQKPSDSEIKNFIANYIPLNIDFSTPSGPAKIGAYNKDGKSLETLVSLFTTKSKTWLLITAPYDINQDKLKQVLSTLRN